MMDKKDLYLEINEHLINDDNPSKYLQEIRDSYNFKEEFPFKMLGDLINTEQNLTHHPEGSVWNHTMMVIDEAAKRKSKSQDERVFMWAALLHDIGKAPTTKLKKGRITSYDHDKVGEELSIKFLREFEEDEVFINKVSRIVRWHMQILFVVKDLPFAELNNMLEETSPREIALFSLCDRLGRGRMTAEKKAEEKRANEIFLQKCDKYLNKNKKAAGGDNRR
jgi:putative nucleotidyltransferase with HDIG domain